MTTEFDLACATCGGQLAKRSISPDELTVQGTVPVAECVDCGDRYFPKRTLEQLE